MDLFTYDTYQDVRKNLFRYSIPFLIGAGFFTYWMILPSDDRKFVRSIFAYLTTSEAWKSVSEGGMIVLLFSFLAFALTELFQVHDQIWDRYIKKWRYYYAIDFILPRLVQPFGSHLNYRFREEAANHVSEFQESLYYPFVGDRDLKIPKNKLVRFYEVITPYWLTQINEIVLFMLTGLVTIYSVVGPNNVGYRTLLLNDCGILLVLFLINRLWTRLVLAKVRRATEDEIRAIHEDPKLLDELEGKLKTVCKNYGIPYT